LNSSSSVLPLPYGTAFSVPELMLLQAWAEFHRLRVVIELDNILDGAEFEEVVVLYGPSSRFRRWTLWRNPESIVIQPANGRCIRFACIQDVLESMIPSLPELSSDLRL
jgi:hypothetical protein